MTFISNLEPQVFMYILSTISEGLTALGKQVSSLIFFSPKAYPDRELLWLGTIHAVLNIF